MKKTRFLMLCLVFFLVLWFPLLKADNAGAAQSLWSQKVKFHHPQKDVYTASQPISGCAWVETNDGVVLIDTLLTKWAARQALTKIHETSGKVKYIIYTHGHLDHVGGCAVFMADCPKEIIANKYVPDRLDKYKMLAEHRARIAAQQFNIPARSRQVYDWIYPTRTFLGTLTLSIGGKTFELHSARGETDDVCWIWVPEIRAAFIGDLLIGTFPNIGNPWKPTRFTLDWAKALEEVRAKNPEFVFCNGAGIVYQGKEALEVLEDTIEAIRSLHDQVVECINKDMHITEMIHAVKLPDHLKDKPYLRFTYSRPEFFVFNTYRWYHGYFDHNPANLLPRPQKEVNAEIFELIGDQDKILRRARELFNQGQAQLGLQVLDVFIQAVPDNIAARKLRIKIIEALSSGDYCWMSRNAWTYFIKKDKEFINLNSNP